MGFFGLFNKETKKENIVTPIPATAPVTEIRIDSPAEYLGLLMVYCDQMEDLSNEIEQISLEAYRGFGKEMDDVIDTAKTRQKFMSDIYFMDFKNPESPPNLDIECQTIHKRIEISSELVSEGLNILETANRTEDSPLFEDGVKKIQEGMRLAVSVAQSRNDLYKEIFGI